MKMYSCDWSTFEDDCSHLMVGVRKGLPVASPFAILGIPCTPADQLECAKSYVARVSPASDNPLWQSKIYSHDRIRVGYLSADFNDHPAAYLTAGFLNATTNLRFEKMAFRSVRQRSRNHRTHKGRAISLSMFGHTATADRSNHLRDGNRYCRRSYGLHHRQQTENLCVTRRTYPDQLFGLSRHHGRRLYRLYHCRSYRRIRSAFQHHFSEKIIYMPETFQSNDRKHRAVSKSFTRADAGLSESVFVFCCFNSIYKITPSVFR